MRIAILGAGAMGMLFGGYLSKENYVVLIDKDRSKVEAINQRGVSIKEPDGTVRSSGPRAALSAEGMSAADLVILFVKSMDSRDALRSSLGLIGPETQVLSMQNGAGHETVLKEFVRGERIILGTTQHNSSIVGPGVIHHGGGGQTYIGAIDGDGQPLQSVQEAFTACGFPTEISDNVQRKIWEKLFVNSSASALTAILQTTLGYILNNGDAWRLAKQLVKEAVAVANGDGMGFEEEKVLNDLQQLLERASNGFTSIYADIRDCRKTEVDTISGAVVAASRRNGVPAPTHEFVVKLIHALEERQKSGTSHTFTCF